MRISDWSSDVCSSDLGLASGMGVRGPVQSPTFVIARTHPSLVGRAPLVHVDAYRLGSASELDDLDIDFAGSVVVIEWGREMAPSIADAWRSEEHTSELQSLMRISYAVFCL